MGAPLTWSATCSLPGTEKLLASASRYVACRERSRERRFQPGHMVPFTITHLLEIMLNVMLYTCVFKGASMRMILYLLERERRSIASILSREKFGALSLFLFCWVVIHMANWQSLALGNGVV